MFFKELDLKGWLIRLLWRMRASLRFKRPVRSDYYWPEHDENPAGKRLDLAKDVAPEYWKHKKLHNMNEREWELLCDGCGKCCLAKMDSENKKEIVFTNAACRLLDLQTCLCKLYEHRKKVVPDCMKITLKVLDEEPRWVPVTCAYWRLHKGLDLPDWHPLITGDPESVHAAGVSVRGRCISESDIRDAARHVVNWDDL